MCVFAFARMCVRAHVCVSVFPPSPVTKDEDITVRVILLRECQER